MRYTPENVVEEAKPQRETHPALSASNTSPPRKSSALLSLFLYPLLSKTVKEVAGIRAIWKKIVGKTQETSTHSLQPVINIHPELERSAAMAHLQGRFFALRRGPEPPSPRHFMRGRQSWSDRRKPPGDHHDLLAKSARDFLAKHAAAKGIRASKKTGLW